ncbi:MAG: hypothetical protein RL141_394 [Candidatus Parcubacteria bacterium]
MDVKDSVPSATVTVCRTCQGDPRAARTCTECRGAGIGLPSPDGLVVWNHPVDDFSLIFRRWARRITVLIHLGLMLFAVGSIGWFVWGVAQLPDVTIIGTSAFWIGGRPEVIAFFVGMLLNAFLVFRFVEYGQSVRPLPTWGKTPAQQEAARASAGEHARQRVDMGLFLDAGAWAVVENAYRLARDLKRQEVTLAHLFAAAVTSSTGSLFLTRLGAKMDVLKEPLARLVNSGEAGAASPWLSRDVIRALLLAYDEAMTAQRKYVSAAEILLQAFAQSPQVQDLLDAIGYTRDQVFHVAEWIRLQGKLRDDHERFTMLAALKPATAMNRSMTARATPLLDRFSEDLTVAARNGYLSPLIGREREMEDLLRAIEGGRRSVVLVGDAGVGKGALVEGLARRMVEENVPEELFDRRLVSINVPQLVSAGDVSLASERLFAVLGEIGASGNIIAVFNGIEGFVGGDGHGPMDLAEALASELDKGYFIAIGTTTPQAYTHYLERHTLGARLARVTVDHMSADDAIRVCMARSASIEYRQQVFFSFHAIEKAVTLSGRYLHERALPEQAIDIMREAAVLAHKDRGDHAFVTAEDVARVVHEKTNVPVESVTEDESEKLLALEQRLHARIIGQDAAVTAVSQALRRARASLQEGTRPIANFLFLGPTGVGKTELTKALAAEYFGSDAAMVRVDMSEYQDAASVARMIGAAGDERGGLLTEAVRRTPFTIVLLDEVEKAHPDILNLFLQVMEDGRLTDGVGRTVDFTNTVIIATSNAGTTFIQEEMKKGTDATQIRTALMERELKSIFRPELLNRFDAVIVFAPLTLEDVGKIARLLLAKVAARLDAQGIRFRADDAAVSRIATEGYDPAFGARPLRRVIQDRVETPLADIILRRAAHRHDTVVLHGDLSLDVEKAVEPGS